MYLEQYLSQCLGHVLKLLKRLSFHEFLVLWRFELEKQCLQQQGLCIWIMKNKNNVLSIETRKIISNICEFFTYYANLPNAEKNSFVHRICCSYINDTHLSITKRWVYDVLKLLQEIRKIVKVPLSIIIKCNFWEYFLTDNSRYLMCA